MQSKYPNLRYKLHTDLRAAVNQAKEIIDSPGLSARYPIDVYFSSYLVVGTKGYSFDTVKLTLYQPDRQKIETGYEALSEKMLDLYDPSVAIVVFKDISLIVQEHRVLCETCPVCRKVLTASMHPARHVKRCSNNTYCRKCQSFINENMTAHEQQCRKKSYPCAKCGLRFERANVRKTHEKDCANTRPEQSGGQVLMFITFVCPTRHILYSLIS